MSLTTSISASVPSISPILTQTWPTTWSALSDCGISSMIKYPGGRIWLDRNKVPDCYPPGNSSALYYAQTPGSCPQGWKWVSEYSYMGADPVSTLYDCCSEGWFYTTYTYDSHLNRICASAIVSDSTINVWGPAASVTSASQRSIVVSSTMAFAGVVHAVYYPQSTDTSTPLPTAAPVQSTAAAASSSGGLSTAAKAGLGAGIAMVALALLSSALFLFICRRKERNELNREGTDYKAELHNNSLLPTELSAAGGNTYKQYAPVSELGGDGEHGWRAELEGNHGSNVTKYELPAHELPVHALTTDEADLPPIPPPPPMTTPSSSRSP